MTKRNFAGLLLVISFCVFTVKADVAPDPGYANVSANLILQTQEEFAEYRFFLQSPIDIEEISLKKGEMKIDSAARGGAKRYVTLIAVPKNALAGLDEMVTGQDESFIDLKGLHREIQNKKIRGVIELVNHSFQKTIPESQKGISHNSVYLVEKDEQKGIKATAMQTTGEGVGFGFYEIKKSYTPLALALIIGGGFISAAIIFLGVWFFRRKRRNLV